MGGSIRIVVAELTMQDGRMTGEVATSVTEGGRTTTTWRQVDSGSPVRLSAAQLDALAFMAADGGTTHVWALKSSGRARRTTLDVLSRLGLTETRFPGCISLTADGRAVLAAARPSHPEPSR